MTTLIKDIGYIEWESVNDTTIEAPYFRFLKSEPEDLATILVIDKKRHFYTGAEVRRYVTNKVNKLKKWNT